MCSTNVNSNANDFSEDWQLIPPFLGDFNDYKDE